MSNDDRADKLLDFVSSIHTSAYQYFILSYCPNHQTDATSVAILQSLNNTARLYFFVQESMFNDPLITISGNEIDLLRLLGSVHILSGHHKDTVRAREFLNFINQHI